MNESAKTLVPDTKKPGQLFSQAVDIEARTVTLLSRHMSTDSGGAYIESRKKEYPYLRLSRVPLEMEPALDRVYTGADADRILAMPCFWSSTNFAEPDPESEESR